MGFNEQARIPALKVLDGAAERAQRHASIRVREHSSPYLGLLYRIPPVEKREAHAVLPAKVAGRSAQGERLHGDVAYELE